MAIHIVPASLELLDQLVSLFEAYRIHFQQDADEECCRAFLEERIRNSDSHIYLAMLEGNAVGFTQLYPIFSSIRLGRLWLLNDLYVHASHRGKGYSKLLLARGKELAKATNAVGLFLESQKENSVHSHLYPSAGFTPNDENIYYFWKNEAFSRKQRT